MSNQPPVLNYLRPRPVPTQQRGAVAWLLWVATAPAWMMATVALMGIVAGMVILAPPLGMYSNFLVIGTLVLGQHIMANLRRNRAAAILAHVEQIVRQNLPLVLMLRLAARAEGGKLRRRLEHVAQALAAGDALAEALASCVPEMPQDTITALALGERTGQLPAVLTRLVDADRKQIRSASASALTSGNFYGLYTVTMLLSITGILAGFLIFVVPKYRDIFSDFRTPLPRPTALLLDASDWFVVDYGWALCGPVLVLVFFTASVCWWRGIFVAARLRFRPLDALFDVVVLRLPLVGKMVLAQGLSSVFMVLAQSAANGAPLLIDAASAIPRNCAVRGRIWRWSEALSAGHALDEAARRAGLPPLVAGTLGPAMAVGCVPAALDFLGRYYGDRANRGLQLLRGALLPATVLVLGLMVGFVAVCLLGAIPALLGGMMPRGGASF